MNRRTCVTILVDKLVNIPYSIKLHKVRDEYGVENQEGFFSKIKNRDSVDNIFIYKLSSIS